MKAAIGLGCSLGPRRPMLELTVQKLAANPALRLLAVSRWYRTPPMRGGTARGWFLNGVALFDSKLDGGGLLGACEQLEEAAGRRRSRHWGDRTLDLDVLLVEGVQRADRRLQLPHPGIASRGFVLEPLLEVWPEAVDAEGRPWADYPPAQGPRPAPVGIMSRRPT